MGESKSDKEKEREFAQKRHDTYEAALGKLVFSSADPAADIAKDLDMFDEDFEDWVNEKADGSDDLEERAGLRSLVEMVQSVRKTVLDKGMEKMDEVEANGVVDVTHTEVEGSAAPATTGSAVVADAETDDAGVLDAMKEIQMGGMRGVEETEEQKRAKEAAAAKAKAAEEAARKTYIAMLDELKALVDEPEELKGEVMAKYSMYDFKFMQTAEEEAAAATDPAEKARISAVLKAVNTEASVRVAEATERLREVMSAGSPQAMEASIVKLGSQNLLDETFLLLIEANRDQALAAGAAGQGAAQVLGNLLERARKEVNRNKDPARALMSKLLAEKDRVKRMDILKDAFTPREQLLMTQNDEKAQAMPDVKPPDFIDVARAMIQQFGNLAIEKDEKLTERLSTIITEAEQVSVSIYGESMTAREQQDRMWSEGTISVWDLETLEQQAEVMGETMPWHGEMDENKFLEGFNKQGIKKIGG